MIDWCKEKEQTRQELSEKAEGQKQAVAYSKAARTNLLEIRWSRLFRVTGKERDTSFGAEPRHDTHVPLHRTASWLLSRGAWRTSMALRRDGLDFRGWFWFLAVGRHSMQCNAVRRETNSSRIDPSRFASLRKTGSTGKSIESMYRMLRNRAIRLPNRSRRK